MIVRKKDRIKERFRHNAEAYVNRITPRHLWDLVFVFEDITDDYKGVNAMDDFVETKVNELIELPDIKDQ